MIPTQVRGDGVVTVEPCLGTIGDALHRVINGDEWDRGI